MTQTPAGWYPDGRGSVRYWDGAQWTSQVRSNSSDGQALPSQPQVSPVYQAPVTSQATAGLSDPVESHSNRGEQNRPYANLITNRSLTKYVLLGFITLGIYGVWVTARTGEDLNTVAGRFDGRRSMNYWLVALLLGPITLGIVSLFWWHTTSNRIGDELERRGLARGVSASTFWLWGILGSLIIVGPFVFVYRWLHSANAMCASYNQHG